MAYNKEIKEHHNDPSQVRRMSLMSSALTGRRRII
jgi:hypothetical protein